MKKIIAVLFLVALVTVFTDVNAQASNQEKLGLDKEQTETLKKQLDGLKEVFGIEGEKTQQTQPSQNQQSTQKKTVADVADKALDMVNKMVADTAATLNKVAPDVWRIMMKQQYAVAISNLIVPWGFFLFAFIYLTVFRKTFGVKWETKSNEGEWAKRWIGYIIPVLTMILFGFVGILSLSESAKILINPEFYAIKSLILILLGK